MLQLDSPLWQFAIQFYQKGKNAQLLLALQDREGLWINQWLATLWASTRQLQLPEQPDHELLQWHHQMVRPMRQLRQQLRQSRYYGDLLDLELEKERVELAHWYRLAQASMPVAGDWVSSWQAQVQQRWPQWSHWPEAPLLEASVKTSA